MKSSKLIGVGFTKSIDKFKNILMRQYSEGKGRPTPELEPLFVENKTKHFYITDSVLKESSRIKLDDPFDLIWLKDKITDRVHQWSFENRMIRFVKSGDKLLAIYLKEVPDPVSKFTGDGGRGIDYVVFDFDITNVGCETWVGSNKQELATEGRFLFYSLLTFIYLAELEVIVVEPKKKNLTKKSYLGFLNEESFPFSIIKVTKNWNKVIVQMKPFWVSGEDGTGFYRKQACGPKWKDRKLIWIEPFEKKKYERTPTKVLNKF